MAGGGEEGAQKKVGTETAHAFSKLTLHGSQTANRATWIITKDVWVCITWGGEGVNTYFVWGHCEFPQEAQKGCHLQFVTLKS